MAWRRNTASNEEETAREAANRRNWRSGNRKQRKWESQPKNSNLEAKPYRKAINESSESWPWRMAWLMTWNQRKKRPRSDQRRRRRKYSCNEEGNEAWQPTGDMACQPKLAIQQKPNVKTVAAKIEESSLAAATAIAANQKTRENEENDEISTKKNMNGKMKNNVKPRRRSGGKACYCCGSKKRNTCGYQPSAPESEENLQSGIHRKQAIAGEAAGVSGEKPTGSQRISRRKPVINYAIWRKASGSEAAKEAGEESLADYRRWLKAMKAASGSKRKARRKLYQQSRRKKISNHQTGSIRHG